VKKAKKKKQHRYPKAAYREFQVTQHTDLIITCTSKRERR